MNPNEIQAHEKSGRTIQASITDLEGVTRYLVVLTSDEYPTGRPMFLRNEDIEYQQSLGHFIRWHFLTEREYYSWFGEWILRTFRDYEDEVVDHALRNVYARWGEFKWRPTGPLSGE